MTEDSPQVAMPHVVSPHSIAAALPEYWSPRVIAEIDDCYVKVAKVRGSLAWHSHDDEDELSMFCPARCESKWTSAPRCSDQATCS
jgi:hypothetical protein